MNCKRREGVASNCMAALTSTTNFSSRGLVACLLALASSGVASMLRVAIRKYLLAEDWDPSSTAGAARCKTNSRLACFMVLRSENTPK